MKAADKETKPMNPRYPCARITPADVVAYALAQGQQEPSLEDAQRWLSHQRRCIKGMMNNIVQDNLETILSEAMCTAYPDPAFDKQYRLIDEAIFIATDEYAQSLGKEYCSSSYQEREMLEVVRRMLAQQDKLTACIEYSQEIGKVGKNPEERVITHRTKRVHLNCEGGNVKAEVVVEDACQHGQDVFMPDKRVARPAGHGPKAGVKGVRREV
jgi:hypothetical protein